MWMIILALHIRDPLDARALLTRHFQTDPHFQIKKVTGAPWEHSFFPFSVTPRYRDYRRASPWVTKLSLTDAG